MEFYHKTDVGALRKVNQDAVASKVLSPNFAWSLICDGMGGANGGDVASNLAVSEVSNYLDENLSENMSLEEIKVLMYNAIENANNKIFEKSLKHAEFSNMGTTIVLCIVKDKTLSIMYAGDSRVYLLSKSGITQLTKDHSVVQEMVDSGEITPEDAKNHPQKNIITRALGVRENIQLDYVKENLNSNDIILLCTDGLTNEISDDNIYNFCMNNAISEIPEKLIRAANISGGRDNITVSVAQI